jgi:hypothetical protein
MLNFLLKLFIIWLPVNGGLKIADLLPSKWSQFISIFYGKGPPLKFYKIQWTKALLKYDVTFGWYTAIIIMLLGRTRKQSRTYVWIVTILCMYCALGWVDFGLFYIFNTSTPEICYLPSKSTENSKKKFFHPVTTSSLVTTFWVMHYIRVQNFFHNMDFMGIKRRRILCRFQKF